MAKIFDIKHFSVHDGPGIRTTVFFKGCPLRCLWCHNPESLSALTQLAFSEKKCTLCGRCAAVCPRGVHRAEEGIHLLHRTPCTACGACAAVCPSGALSIPRRTLSEEELFAVAERQRRLGGKDGGITFSGGEPLLYAEELIALIPRLGIHTAIETSGYADGELFRRLLAVTDYVMLDLKLADDALHRRYTGVSNERILENLAILRASGRPFLLRTPLIPGITDTEENLAAIGAIVGSDPWECLPYHGAAAAKHARLGLPYGL